MHEVGLEKLKHHFWELYDCGRLYRVSLHLCALSLMNQLKRHDSLARANMYK